jgi:hypothetical protein
MYVNQADLRSGTRVIVYMGTASSGFHDLSLVATLATIIHKIDDRDAYWVDVHTGPGLTLSQVYGYREILGLAAPGLEMRQAEQATLPPLGAAPDA